jgi:hypothetical protein
LPWEPENEFEKFSLEFKNSLKPQGSIENFLIDRLITIGWRIKRIAILEAGIITVKCYENQKKYVESELHQMRFPERIDPELRNNKERFNKYIDVCILKDQIQSGMLEDIPTMGAIIQESMDTFITLQRYEKQLEKQFFMTLYQLEKIQNQRKAIPAVTVEN